MPQNFPNVWKKTDAQVQESQRVPKKMDLKRSTPTDVILKSEKLENFKGSKIKKKNYLISIIRSTDFPSEILEVKWRGRIY